MSSIRVKDLTLKNHLREIFIFIISKKELETFKKELKFLKF